MKFKLAFFLVFLVVLFSTRQLILPLISPLSGYLALIVLSWKLSHVASKRFLAKYGRVSTIGKAVLITGCDSGFGNLLAHKLNKLGFHVFAGCLDRDSKGAAELSTTAHNRRLMHVIEMDVTNDNHILNCRQVVDAELAKKSLQLHAVVNNAGVGYNAFIEWYPATSVDDYKKNLDVNCLGLIRTTRMFLPLIRKSKGRVVNLTSAMGRMPLYTGSHYAASKHAAVGFSDSLALEMYKFGVDVVSIEPWFYPTAIMDTDRNKRNMRNAFHAASDEVKEAYGGNEALELGSKFLDVVSKSPWNMEENVQDVIDALTEAVISSEPDPTYRVMSFKRKFLNFFAAEIPYEFRLWLMTTIKDRYEATAMQL
ncbi:Retinol dehydrogenase 7 [Halotydeus destructor]|nr:Retinol dehydrogenase 7 [Halotydeus destructor]